VLQRFKTCHSALWRRLVIRNVMSLAARKFTKTPIFGSMSFKVTDVGTTGKLVGSTSYDTQQVCVYLQPFSR